MASTWEPTRAVIKWQNAGTGEVAYLGEEAYSEAKKTAGILKDTNFGKWVFANFPNGVVLDYIHNAGSSVTNTNRVSIQGTSAGATTITATTIAA